ncbi:THO complex subunit 7 homolog [Ptychodera flava]|uniref:THO complex subunit 7 homolog n=1 Tax=Ptychodera flava TaxID=63121 RepID=UPI00396A80CF
MAASITDDEIIRKRLLIDGDVGGGDDRRISSLLKTFTKWCQSSGSDEECTAAYQRMLSTISQCEFSMAKTQMVYDMNQREMTKYEQIYKDIEKSISDAHEKIASSKTELQEAKRIRKNRQEYDALAKVIQKHPDRQGTLKKLEELDRELNSLTDQKEALENKLEMRRKQFHVLITSIHELQRILDEDEKEELDSSTMDTSALDSSMEMNTTN